MTLVWTTERCQRQRHTTSVNAQSAFFFILVSFLLNQSQHKENILRSKPVFFVHNSNFDIFCSITRFNHVHTFWICFHVRHRAESKLCFLSTCVDVFLFGHVLYLTWTQWTIALDSKMKTFPGVNTESNQYAFCRQILFKFWVDTFKQA